MRVVPELDPTRIIPQVQRVLAAAEALGAEIVAKSVQGLDTIDAVERELDRSCLVVVHINPEMRVKVARGAARPVLATGDWRTFLVKVDNEAGTTAALRVTSPHARSAAGAPPGGQTHRWLDLRMHDDPPLSPGLTGLELEYRIVQLYSHDAGRREASLAFDVGQGTQDLGFRNEVPILFECRRLDEGNLVTSGHPERDDLVWLVLAICGCDKPMPPSSECSCATPRRPSEARRERVRPEDPGGPSSSRGG